jgi:hypothetical protein
MRGGKAAVIMLARFRVLRSSSANEADSGVCQPLASKVERGWFVVNKLFIPSTVVDITAGPP